MPSIAVQADTIATKITVGSRPFGVTINPAGTFAYVVNQGSNDVSKINLATDTIVATITVGTTPSAMAINPAGTFAYVTNASSKTVSKINLATDTVVATIEYGLLGMGPCGVAINPAGTFAYVGIASGTISKINLATDTVVATITVGRNPCDVAINPAGTFAYVANGMDETVSKINLATDTVVATIKVAGAPRGVAIDPAGAFAYVISFQDKVLNKINLTTDTVDATVAVATYPYFVAINAAGTFAYVSSGVGTVSKINLATYAVASTVTAGGQPYNLAINPAGTFAYVANMSGNYVSKIAIAATDPQSITFTTVGTAVVPAPLTQLIGSKTVSVVASASSGLTVAFSSSTPSVCTVSGSTVTMVKIGDCTINANQAGGSGFDAASQVTQTFAILPSPQTGEIGVSINSGEIFTNTRSVKLDLVWPEYATSALISNDGGFLASKTSTIQLAASVDWTLASSGSERLPKIVYVRFIKSTGNVTTFTDDIILDMTPPALTSATAVVSSTTAGSVSVLSVGAKSKNGIKLLVKASDANSGIGWIEVRTSSNSAATKIRYAKPKNKSQTFNLKTTSKSIQVRVLDLAGNTSKWKTVKVR
jgi:YVTN family beta-propeller protein